MSADNLTQRHRDPRYHVPPGFGSIEFRDARRAGEQVHGSVLEIGVAGIAFELENFETPFDGGELLSGVTLRFGSCVLDGDVVVRGCRESASAKLTVGGLFYPEATRCMDRMVGLIAGLSVMG